MEITIKIAKIGTMKGTVGDLVRGLKIGEYFFKESHATNGDIGLWLKSKNGKLSQCVAIYNPYNLDGSEMVNHDPFRFSLSQSVDQGYREIWTDSAWKAIVRVAEQWCDDRNRELDDEKIPELHLVRVN